METLLQKRRKAAGLSQSQLSDISGVNFRSLQDYEQGRKTLFSARSELLYRLSVALNCSMEDLLIDVDTEINREIAEREFARRSLLYYTGIVDKENIGCIDIEVDGITPCLIDVASGQKVETDVYRIESSKTLREFNKSNGWHIDWGKMGDSVEIYALTTRHNNEIQGLIGIKNDYGAQAAYIHWACTAPHNNIRETGSKKYIGVGGHLFAIAAEKSCDWGYSGMVHAFAANKELLEYYQKELYAQYLGMMHIYQFLIDEEAAAKLMEVYDYEWK